jgi:CheY-like chemotaxis protein
MSDSGVGMDEQTLSMIFEPFFTTKEKGKGTGLGLSTCYGIVRQHNGFIHVASTPQEGTSFDIIFPRSWGMIDEQRALQDSQEGDVGGRVVLLVEDDPMVRSIIREMLETGGYRVIEFESGRDALLRLDKIEISAELLITDVVMPHMNGKRLAEEILALIPSIKVLYISGYTDEVIAKHGVLEPGMAFIQKPFKRTVLMERIRELLEPRG